LANLFIGLYWQRMGSHETALEYFQEAESSWPDQADVLVEEGKSLAALGDLEGALNKYQAAVDLQPDQDQYFRQLAEFTITYSYQIPEIGLPAARFAVQLAPTNPANPTVLGKVLLELEDGYNAQKLFQQALSVDPLYAPAHFQLGILYSARGSEEEAVYYLQQTVTYSSNPALIDQARRLLASY
jgi:tetratricopeptide (TPR) repeat protein